MCVLLLMFVDKLLMFRSVTCVLSGDFCFIVCLYLFCV